MEKSDTADIIVGQKSGPATTVLLNHIKIITSSPCVTSQFDMTSLSTELYTNHTYLEYILQVFYIISYTFFER